MKIKELKINELIELLVPFALEEEKEVKKGTLPHDAVYGDFSVLTFLRDLKEKDPNGLVMISNGECENPGVYVPMQEDGKDFDWEKRKPFEEGEAFPEGDWIQVAYLRAKQAKQRPSISP